MDSPVTQKFLSPLLASLSTVHTAPKWSALVAKKSIRHPTDKTSYHALASDDNGSAKQTGLLPMHSVEHFLVDNNTLKNVGCSPSIDTSTILSFFWARAPDLKSWNDGTVDKIKHQCIFY